MEGHLDYDIAEHKIYNSSINLKDSDGIIKELSSLDWEFVDDNTTYLSHGIHPYSAKFIPQLPSKLISYLSITGDLVWDPFGGSGTTALEAILLDRRCISSDANPLSEIIGKAKSTALTDEHVHELKSWSKRLTLSTGQSSLYDTQELIDLKIGRAHV